MLEYLTKNKDYGKFCKFDYGRLSNYYVLCRKNFFFKIKKYVGIVVRTAFLILKFKIRKQGLIHVYNLLKFCYLLRKVIFWRFFSYWRQVDFFRYRE